MRVFIGTVAGEPIVIEKPDYYSPARPGESLRKNSNKNQEAIAKLDRLSTMCRDTVQSLYGTDFQNAIGPIKWLGTQLTNIRSQEITDESSEVGNTGQRSEGVSSISDSEGSDGPQEEIRGNSQTEFFKRTYG